jgi:hypothetical protein
VIIIITLTIIIIFCSIYIAKINTTGLPIKRRNIIRLFRITITSILPLPLIYIFFIYISNRIFTIFMLLWLVINEIILLFILKINKNIKTEFCLIVKFVVAFFLYFFVFAETVFLAILILKNSFFPECIVKKIQQLNIISGIKNIFFGLLYEIIITLIVFISKKIIQKINGGKHE